MTAVLVVEDDPYKMRSILNFLKQEYPSVEIAEARSVKGGRKRLREQKYELVLLDMSLPTFDLDGVGGGGRPQTFGGSELLKEMLRLRIFTPVVVLTQYTSFGDGEVVRTLDDLSKDLASAHANLLATIYYNPTTDGWKAELLALLQKIILSPSS